MSTRTAMMEDRVSIELPDKSSRSYTPEGFLRTRANITRSGMFVYNHHELGVSDPGRNVRVMRTDDTVCHEDTIKSVRGSQNYYCLKSERCNN